METFCRFCHQLARLRYFGTVKARNFFMTNGHYTIADSPRKDKLNVYECNNCNLAFSVPEVSEDELNKYYIEQTTDELYLSEERGRRAAFRRMLQRAVRMGAKKGNCFDYGAGPGFLMAEARDLGWEVKGREVSRWAQEYASRRFGFNLSQLNALDTEPDNSLDLIAFCDVLEHLIEPFSLLNIAKRKLKPGGFIIITVPRYESLVRKLCGRNWYAMFPAHLTYFTEAALNKFLKQAGFGVVAKKKHIVYFSLGYLLYRFLGLFSIKNIKVGKFLNSIIVPFSLGDEIELYAQRLPK